jgi:hypothetical protein
MASVEVMTAAHVQELLNLTVQSATIDSSGFLVLTLGDGVTQVTVGQVSTPDVIDSLIKGGSINGLNHLILTRSDDSTLDVGSFTGGFVASGSIDGSNRLVLTKGDGTTLLVGAFTNAFIKSGAIDGSHHLILTKGDNTTQDVGDLDSNPDSAWHTLGLPTGGGSWTVQKGRYRLVRINAMNFTMIDIQLSGSGTTGTLVASIMLPNSPTNYRPIVDRQFPLGNTSTVSQDATAYVLTTGEVGVQLAGSHTRVGGTILVPLD